MYNYDYTVHYDPTGHTLPYSQARLAALSAVQQHQVRYHNGLATPAVGYRWCEALGGGPLMADAAEALRELWERDFVDIDTQLLACQGLGHEVRLTHRGWLALKTWRSRASTVPFQQRREAS